MKTLKNLVGMIARIADELEKTNARLDRLVECWETKPIPPKSDTEEKSSKPHDDFEGGVFLNPLQQVEVVSKEGSTKGLGKKPKWKERWDRGDVEMLVKMYSDGKSRIEIAKALGVDYTRVASKLYSLGVRK